MASEKTATARYEGGMRFEITAGSGHTLTVDSLVSESAPTAGFSPMELPLMALLGCMGMDVVSILAKMRQELTGYQMSTRGIRAKEHPQVFVQIEVEHIFTGNNLSREAIDRAMELSRTKYCSVSAMLEKTAQITHTVRVVAQTEPGAQGVTETSAPTR
ncbi:MAG TPA: OsmC family protein [Ktedonobacterales bacterium]